MKALLGRLSLVVLVFSGLALGQFAQANPWGVQNVPPETEIQIFVNYRANPGSKATYDFKLVSTWASPLSASHVYFDFYETPTNAACYWGVPGEAYRLFSFMVDTFNRENHRNIRIDGGAYYDWKIKKDALNIWVTDEHGQRYEWFPRMRECNRRSTADERRN